MYSFCLPVIFVFYIYIKACNGANNCTEVSDCYIEGSACIDDTCQCPPDYILNSDMTQCLLISDGYGSQCVDSVQCSARLQSGGQCRLDPRTGNMTCQCEPGFHYLYGWCWRSSGLDASCRTSDYCYANYDFESTSCNDNKICQCADGYYKREYSACRRASYAPGQPCGIFLDCQFENAVCTRDRVCANGTGYSGEISNEPADSKDTNLLADGLNYWYTMEENTGDKVGENCSWSPVKKGCNISYATCSAGGRCECNLGYYPSDELDSCLPELGSACSNDTNCQGRYMMCRNGSHCACKTGYVARSDNQLCEKMSRNISWSCLYTEECSFFGEAGICVDKKCQCKEGTHFVPEQLFCWTNKDVGAACVSDYDCYIKSNANVRCDIHSNSCSCEEGYHSADNNTDCRLNGTEPGMSCVEHSDCMFIHAACDHGICKCDIGYYEGPDRYCLPGLGGSCVDNCQLEHTVCEQNKCICEPEHVPNTDGSLCLQEAAQYGDECIEAVQCTHALGPSSDCLDKTCQCQPGYHFSNEYCYLSVPLGKPCCKNCECVEGADKPSHRTECKKGVCSCKFQYEYNEEDRICSGTQIARLEISAGFLISLIVLYKGFVII